MNYDMICHENESDVVSFRDEQLFYCMFALDAFSTSFYYNGATQKAKPLDIHQFYHFVGIIPKYFNHNGPFQCFTNVMFNTAMISEVTFERQVWKSSVIMKDFCPQYMMA